MTRQPHGASPEGGSTGLTDLLARVEAAEGPNFELKCAIFEALSIPKEWFGSRVVGHFRQGADYGFNTEDGFRHLDCLRAPNYTASLDAALALCERVLPGVFWNVGTCSLSGPQRYSADFATGGGLEEPGVTPALALLAAMLKALIAQAAGPRSGSSHRLDEPLLSKGGGESSSREPSPSIRGVVRG